LPPSLWGLPTKSGFWGAPFPGVFLSRPPPGVPKAPPGWPLSARSAFSPRGSLTPFPEGYPPGNGVPAPNQKGLRVNRGPKTQIKGALFRVFTGTPQFFAPVFLKGKKVQPVSPDPKTLKGGPIGAIQPPVGIVANLPISRPTGVVRVQLQAPWLRQPGVSRRSSDPSAPCW